MDKKPIKIHLFFKTGGPQPESLDPSAINKFFIGDYAKQWAMLDGYLPTYISYENGVIKFKLVTDPRIDLFNWLKLCNSIAKEYKTKVELLKDATNFEVAHFIANDIIGFNIESGDPEKIKAYQARIKASNDALPEKPKMRHYGIIV